MDIGMSRVDKNNSIKQSRNSSIDILRLVFAILIVAMHSSPLIEISPTVSYIFTQIISRLAVPFFSVITGYYFFKSDNPYKFFNYIKKYIVLYTFWSLAMYFFEAITWKGTKKELIIRIIRWYFVEGWHHLWYLLAIIYFIGILWMLNRISKTVIDIVYWLSLLLLSIGIAISNYGTVFLKFPILELFNIYNKNMQIGFPFVVIPFFMLGYTLNKQINGWIVDRVNILIFLSIIGLLVEVGITTVLNLHNNVVLCIFTYPVVYFITVWAISNPCVRLGTLARYCAGMASVMYFSHYIIVLVLSSVGITETLVFIISIITTSIAGIIITKINNPVINNII